MFGRKRQASKHPREYSTRSPGHAGTRHPRVCPTFRQPRHIQHHLSHDHAFSDPHRSDGVARVDRLFAGHVGGLPGSPIIDVRVLWGLTVDMCAGRGERRVSGKTGRFSTPFLRARAASLEESRRRLSRPSKPRTDHEPVHRVDTEPARLPSSPLTPLRLGASSGSGALPRAVLNGPVRLPMNGSRLDACWPGTRRCTRWPRQRSRSTLPNLDPSRWKDPTRPQSRRTVASCTRQTRRRPTWRGTCRASGAPF